MAFHKYAAAGSQPAMCRFLIESGADVDHVGYARGVPGYRYRLYVGNRYIRTACQGRVIHANLVGISLTPLVCTNRHRNIDYSEEVLDCRRYLLDAGCDPTIPVFYQDYKGDLEEDLFEDAFGESFLGGHIVQHPYSRTILCSGLTLAILGCHDDDAG